MKKAFKLENLKSLAQKKDNTHGTMLKKSVICGVALASTCHAFTQSGTTSVSNNLPKSSTTSLNGLFDDFIAGGSGNSKESLDDQWEAQQRMLKMRKGSTKDKTEYFGKIEERRLKESKKLDDKWGWQRKNYAKGEDPITEWRKKRKEGVISDLEDQYGDPKEVGGIPIPGASFGIGGEFGVGGMYYLVLFRILNIFMKEFKTNFTRTVHVSGK